MGRTLNDEHVWLGLDPGVTTGWAVLDDTGKVMLTGNLTVTELQAGLDELIRRLHRSGYRIDAVVELMPRVGGVGVTARQMEDVWRALYTTIQATYEVPYVMVRPGEWKPSRVARTTKIRTKGLTVHQRDAIKMTLYVMEKKNGHDHT